MTSLVERRAVSGDGAPVRYFASGGPESAPTLILANWLCGRTGDWERQISYLGDRFRVIGWEYRGLFSNHLPTPDRGLDTHLADLDAILTAEGVTSASIAGWSTGVLMALGACRRWPGRIDSLVLLNGAPGRPTASARPRLGPLLAKLAPLAASAHGPSRNLVLGHTDRIGRWLAAPSRLDPNVVARIVEDVLAVDARGCVATLEGLATVDAAPWLPDIHIPALVIAGGRDRLTPAPLAHAMARQLPNSELTIVAEGGHFLCLEFPELIALRLEQFYRGAGLCA